MLTNKDTQIISSLAGKRSSLASLMYNSAFQHLNLNFMYISIAIQNEENAITGLKEFNFKGSAVTMPFKQSIISHLDKINEHAKNIGAVNVINNLNGKLVGYNSDYIGAIDSLKEVTNLKGKKVILIGAGGVGRAIAYGLKVNGAKVKVYNRTIKKAQSLVDEFDLELGGSIEDLNETDYDILINATSIGYHNYDESIIDKDKIVENKIVMDVITKRIETKFLKYAREKNCKVIPGYRMLILQAAFPFKLFTGVDAPIDYMEEILLEELKKNE